MQRRHTLPRHSRSCPPPKSLPLQPQRVEDHEGAELHTTRAGRRSRCRGRPHHGNGRSNAGRGGAAPRTPGGGGHGGQWVARRGRIQPETRRSGEGRGGSGCGWRGSSLRHPAASPTAAGVETPVRGLNRLGFEREKGEVGKGRGRREGRRPAEIAEEGGGEASRLESARGERVLIVL